VPLSASIASAIQGPLVAQLRHFLQVTDRYDALRGDVVSSLAVSAASLPGWQGRSIN
jgi:hypothetical protein